MRYLFLILAVLVFTVVFQRVHNPYAVLTLFVVLLMAAYEVGIHQGRTEVLDAVNPFHEGSVDESE